MLKKIVLTFFFLSISRSLFAIEPIPGRLLIKVKLGYKIESIVPQIQYKVVEYIYRRASFKNNAPETEKTYGLIFSEAEDIRAISESIKKISGVKWVSLDYKIDEPSQPIKTAQIVSGLDTPINAVYIPDTEHRYIRYIPIQQEILVAVIDQGIKYDHRDLKDAIFKNSAEIPNNGIDDDGNGLVDDYMGYDFTQYAFGGGSNDPTPSSPHGTMVAGLIGAKKDDKLGICGVNPNCKILNVKWNSVADISYCIRYAVDMGAKVINCSFGFANIDTEFPDFRESYAYAIEKGCIVVVSAGNNGVQVNDNPQRFPNMTVVTSHTGLERQVPGEPVRYGGANYGPEVSFASYGVNVYSTGVDEWSANEGTGTSYSAPIVAGILSRIWANNPSLTRQQVLDKAIQYTVPLDSGTGHGRIDSEALAKSYVTVQTKKVNLNLGNKRGLLEVDYVTSNGVTRRFAESFYFSGRKYSIHREL